MPQAKEVEDCFVGPGCCSCCWATLQCAAGAVVFNGPIFFLGSRCCLGLGSMRALPSCEKGRARAVGRGPPARPPQALVPSLSPTTHLVGAAGPCPTLKLPGMPLSMCLQRALTDDRAPEIDRTAVFVLGRHHH